MFVHVCCTKDMMPAASTSAVMFLIGSGTAVVDAAATGHQDCSSASSASSVLSCRMICMCWHGYTALLFTICQPFLWSDPVTVVKASPQECNGPRKWSSVPLRLSGVHRTSKLLGCSINTLAVSCLAGGIRRYVVRHGAAPVQRVRLCSMVDTRSMPGMLTGTDGNSNNFSFIGVPLFTGDCSPLVRVARVGWGLSWIRHSPAVPLAIRMPGIIQVGCRQRFSCFCVSCMTGRVAGLGCPSRTLQTWVVVTHGFLPFAK